MIRVLCGVAPDVSRDLDMVPLRLLFSLVVLAFSLGVVASVDAAAPKPRPNIVVVFIDDMGWGDLSCFGNKAVETQNIDRLAAEGIRFEQFYVNSPICSPSRVAISTGQYPHRWRITSYLSNRQHNEARGVAQWLDPKAPMLARMLHDSGYATGHFGKWHMGGQRDVGEAPLISEYGFDASLTNFWRSKMPITASRLSGIRWGQTSWGEERSRTLIVHWLPSRSLQQPLNSSSSLWLTANRFISTSGRTMFIRRSFRRRLGVAMKRNGHFITESLIRWMSSWEFCST